MKLYRLPTNEFRITGRSRDASNLIISKIFAGEPEEKALLAMLRGPQVTWHRIVSLALDSPDIIDPFFDTHPELNEDWAEQLRQVKHLSFPVRAIDGENTISIFSLYKGLFLMGRYNLMKREEPENTECLQALLNCAVDCGNFDAWIETMNLMVLTEQSKPDDFDPSDLFNTTREFSECYWSAGYLNAGVYLLDIAEHYHHAGNQETATIAVEAAIEAFYSGFQLMDHPTSQDVLDVLYPDRGWPEIFRQYDPEQTWNCDAPETALLFLIDMIKTKYNITNPEELLPRLEATALENTRLIMARNPPERKLAASLTK